MTADLHIHSTCSDGTDKPDKIVEMAAAAGLSCLALTDHDSIDGLAQATEQGRRLGVEVIPGIELTTESPNREIHILGYYFDPGQPEFLAILKKIQQSRVERIKKMVKKLNSLKIDLEVEDVLTLSDGKTPGRPHVARALINQGQVKSIKEAFDRYLETRGPAYVPHYKLKPVEAIHLIRAAGGIPVLAHPLISNCDELIVELKKEGLGGVEAYYSGYTPATTERYVMLAQDNGLLVTGGSDFHGQDSGRENQLGSVKLPEQYVEALKNEHLHRH